jgi:hypothetical protein
MQPDLDNLRKAFALAHRAQNDYRHSPEARAVFSAIAYHLWHSVAETKREKRNA